MLKYIFYRISNCKHAKENIVLLRSYMRVLVKLKNLKLNLVVHKYVLFKFDDSETISEMFNHFSNIINGRPQSSWQNIYKCRISQRSSLHASKEMGTRSYCYPWGEGPHLTLTGPTYRFPHYSRNDQFEWRWEEENLALKACPNNDEEDFHDEDITFLSRKFKMCFITKGFVGQQHSKER